MQQKVSGEARITHSRRTGFTLIELMMVLTVISILVSIAIPIANSAIIRSKEAVLRSNLYTLENFDRPVHGRQAESAPVSR